MSLSTIGILLIITIILLLTVIILVIFQFNKMSLENTSLQQIVSDEKQNEKDKILDMQSNIVLHTKNNILEGFGSINRGLLDNNENLLLKFSDLGTKLGSTMFENSQLLSNNINSFKDEFKKNINEDFDKLNIKVESKLDMINSKVEERLTKGFEETTKTFNNVIERLSKIDEAQKKIDSLSTNIISLQDVLTDKKSRGIFGEVQLYQILTSIFGEKNDKIFNTQYKLSTGVLVDAIVFAPSPVGNIGIDSKFPLENYKRIYDQETSDTDRQQARKDFVLNLKKHIDDISNKYIIAGETADQAILFLPAEAIFAEINAYHSDILEYANKKRVWIVSPTTLMSVLTTLQVVMTNIERDKYAHVIQEELVKLGQEFDRYQKRWASLEKDIDKVLRDVKDVTTTSNKISKRFDEISNVKLLESSDGDIVEISGT